MTQNKLSDLNNHLFEQLERLNQEDLTDEQLDNELRRTQGVTQLATSIVNNAKVVVEAKKIQGEYGFKNQPAMFGIENND